jgi:hypothetical protein
LVSGNTPLERRYCGRSKVLFFKLRCEWLPGVDPLLDWPGRRPGPIAPFDARYWRAWWQPKHKHTFNQLLQLQARILDWIALVIPNLDEVIGQHLQTHSQFNAVFDVIEHKLAPNLRIEELACALHKSARFLHGLFPQHRHESQSLHQTPPEPASHAVAPQYRLKDQGSC